MARTNRVDPWGIVRAVPDRGTLLGNRGVIHDTHENVIRTHKSQAWITCRLEFKDITRPIMSPGKWTELFFLDEATAFSAGHRPCGYCRRDRFNEFKSAWLRANGDRLGQGPRGIERIDKVVHPERISQGRKVTYKAPLRNLPSGTMIEEGSQAYLVWNNNLFRWGFAGYSFDGVEPQCTVVSVLTPETYVRAFVEGFRPTVHSSLSTANQG